MEEGFLFHNHYLLKRVLGRGGFSEVWLAEDVNMDNLEVALKVYAPRGGMDNDGVQSFRRELKMVFDLHHSHLLCPRHFDVCNRSPYLVLPYCTGGSADKFLGENKIEITEDEAWRFLHDVASGLAYLHEQKEPIIHQDIKPHNVLMDDEGNYLITDFGISARARNTLRKSMGDVVVALTVAYTPPERFERNNLPVMASDIWSLGATMFELLEGDTPYSDHGGLVQKSGAEIPEITGNWSPELKKIVELCLQKETWDRPTAVQLVKWAEERKITEPPGGGKKKAMIVIAGIAVIAVLCGLYFGGIFDKPPPPPPPPPHLTVSPESPLFTASGGIQTINVSTNGASYDVTDLPSWCEVSKQTNTSFQIVCQANTGAARSGSVWVISGGLKEHLIVKQEAGVTMLTPNNDTNEGKVTPIFKQLTVTPTSPWFDSPGGNYTINVSTDAATYDVTNSLSWCNVTNKTDASFQIVCQANSGAERSGSFIVKAGSREERITVKQAACITTRLSATPTSLPFSFSGGTQTISVSTDCASYDVTNLPSWCNVTNKTGASFQIVCQANSGAYRSGSFNIKSGSMEIRLTVEQAAGRNDEEVKTRLSRYRQAGKNLGTAYIVVQRISDSKWGIIDREGNERTNFIYIQVSSPLKNGCFALMNEQKKWDVFNPSLEKIASGIENLNNYE